MKIRKSNENQLDTKAHYHCINHWGFLAIGILGSIGQAISPSPTTDSAVTQTDTAQPSPTPTPVLTYEQRMQNAINLTGSKVTFDAKNGNVVVTYYAGEQIN